MALQKAMVSSKDNSITRFRPYYDAEVVELAIQEFLKELKENLININRDYPNVLSAINTLTKKKFGEEILK